MNSGNLFVQKKWLKTTPENPPLREVQDFDLSKYAEGVSGQGQHGLYRLNFPNSFDLELCQAVEPLAPTPLKISQEQLTDLSYFSL